MAKVSKLPKVTRTAAAAAPLTLAQAERHVESRPQDAKPWKAYVTLLTNHGRHETALEALRRAAALAPEDPFIHSTMAIAHHKRNEIADAKACLEKAFALDPEHAQGLMLSGVIEQEAGRNEMALAYFERAERIIPGDAALLRNKAITLSALSRFDEALVLLEGLLARTPKSFALLNDIGNIRRDLGAFEGLDDYFQRAIELAGDDPVPFSNRLTYVHYDPAWSREAIFEVCREWQRRYAPANPPARPVPADLSPARRLRIGLFSDGFRNHPVGSMIVEALTCLNRQDLELYFYPTHADEDRLTQRLRALATRWQPIKHLGNEQFAQRVRDDHIDILFDLSGHNSGTRAKAVAMQPAPLLVKWVGGLINTTGIEAMDYLISDAVETPPGDAEDALFVEKLIRMPDDYIVFSPPPHAPPVRPLPARHNGYITLGCFNNPTKINPATLREWAKLMRELPDSRLFLKGKPYTSESFRQRIIDLMASEGIEEERLIIEGPASHRGLMDAYNRVDIALDPWPYSGGLTTCEAMLMGVPVVTLPGPTFAGRHSATHLVNAGLPELVVNDWDEYRERVLELAGDLDSLSTIRGHLRDILLQSPVCDGKRFARHLMVAIRAIWQRYCEGKAPAPLTFEKDGQAWFKGESEPVQVQIAEPQQGAGTGFNWELPGRIMTVDNSGRLLTDRGMQMLLGTEAFALVAFDPRSLTPKPERYHGHKSIQIVPHALLGNGQPATLHACLDATLSSTLEPLPADRLPEDLRQGAQVLTRLPINTVALDSIDGLSSLDWLLLDELCDVASILEHGAQALRDTLLIEARIAFQPTHQGQSSLDEIRYWAGLRGFRFYHLGRQGHRSHLPQRSDLKKTQSTELVYADALFIPNEERMAALSDGQRSKLAFLLHTIHGIRDLSYALLAAVDAEKAEAYLRTEGILAELPTPRAEQHKPAAPELLLRKDITHTAGIGVPLYNEEKYVEETLRSLREQDYDDVVFFICDNASTDRTLEIVRDLSAGDERFRIHRHDENIGASDNFKFALDKTAARYFMWLGGHDYLSANYLKSTVPLLAEDASVAMACGMPCAVMEGKQPGLVRQAIYDFSAEDPLVRYVKSVAELSNCTIIHSLFEKKLLDDFEVRKTISPDHVLISHLLWYGKLRFAEQARYFRRYFESRSESVEERILGRRQELPREDFYRYYDDDFAALLRAAPQLGPERAHQERARVQDILRRRFAQPAPKTQAEPQE